MRLVQLNRNGERRVGVVDGSQLRLVGSSMATTYELARQAIASQTTLTLVVEAAMSKDVVNYDDAYAGQSEWRILPSFDHPKDAAHCLVSGTGLTHKASAKNRAAMHTQTAAELTDSYRMFQLGLEGGSPATDEIGVQPEWFYKGNGSILKGHLDTLTVPSYGEDGGEEPEIAGVYLISERGEPYLVGLTVANEFSDHRMEKRNYLYLAPSKLRECSIGPELTIGSAGFDDVPGTVEVRRKDETIWSSEIWTGETNMSHSLANLEHHHFKYDAHRNPGDVHVHFYGADAFSFGAGIALESGDLMEVSFPKFGRALRNMLQIEPKAERPVRVLTL